MIAVVEYGELSPLIRIADLVRAKFGRDVTVFFAKHHYRDLARDTSDVLARGYRWLDWHGTEFRSPAPADLPEKTGGAGALPARKPSQLRAWLGDFRALARDMRNFRRRYREIEAILRRARPELLILGQDLLGKELSFALIAARRLGIPTLIAPFAMFSIRELAQYALARPEHHLGGRPLNALLASRYPHWVFHHDGQALLRLPGSRGLALEWTGLVGGNPWVPCSEPATMVACDSRVAMRNFLAMGLPEQRLRVVGSPTLDRLGSAVSAGSSGRDQLMARHGLDRSRPLLVCGWPANIFSWLGERRIGYENYEALAEAWARALARAHRTHGVEVLISVHPKTLDAELEAAKRHALKYQRGDTEEAVAHCDAFVTLNGSSITAWAIACCKPVLLFDCYRTGYEDFDHASGCIMVHDERAFRSQLDRLCADSSHRAALSAAHAAIAADWGELDGRSGERLAAVCAELMSRPA